MPRRTTKSAGPDPVDIAVGKRVRLRRLQLEMSQTELADKLGVTFQQVQKYEKGTNRISCSRLSEMAEALDFPITSFFSDENEPLTEMTVTENLDPGHMKDGLRLLTAFGRINGGTVRGDEALADRDSARDVRLLQVEPGRVTEREVIVLVAEDADRVVFL